MTIPPSPFFWTPSLYITGCTSGGVYALVFTHIDMPGKTCCGQLGSLLLCLCDVFWALINSLVHWFCTGTQGLVLFQIAKWSQVLLRMQWTKDQGPSLILSDLIFLGLSTTKNQTKQTTMKQNKRVGGFQIIHMLLRKKSELKKPVELLVCSHKIISFLKSSFVSSSSSLATGSTLTSSVSVQGRPFCISFSFCCMPAWNPHSLVQMKMVQSNRSIH